MPARIICVDDEPRVLKGLRRRLGREYDVEIAESGGEALEILRSQDPFQVIISDMRMPVMNGAQFLARAQDEFPDTVRMLLTGQSDLDDAIAAINQGNIFRFLTKPCPPEVLLPALEMAVEQYRLIQAERELLEGTLRGSIALLTEILEIKDPVAASRGVRLKNYVRDLAAELELEGSWDYEVAAALSEIGYAVLPSDVVDRWRRGDELSAAEEGLVVSQSRLAQDLLINIPRLEGVAAMVGALAAATPPTSNERVARGVALIEAVGSYDRHIQSGLAEGAAVAALRKNGSVADASILKALDRMAVASGGYIEKDLGVADLVSGLLLAADLYASDGRLLLTEGTELSHAAKTRILQYAAHIGIREPIRVRVPI
jgi:response regulator RpfG family c-di-GMP phosphodiesterase